MNKTNKVLALTELIFRLTNENRKTNWGVFYLSDSFANADQKGRQKALRYREMYGGIPSYAHVHSKYISGAEKNLLQILFVSLGKLLSMSLCWVSPPVKWGNIFYLPHRAVGRSKLINTGKVQCISQGKHTVSIIGNDDPHLHHCHHHYILSLSPQPHSMIPSTADEEKLCLATLVDWTPYLLTHPFTCMNQEPAKLRMWT